jgi:flagellar M-ring protein FliF
MGARLSRFTGFWNGLTGPSRRLIVSAAVIFFVGLVILWRMSGSIAYANLTSGVDPQDAASITTKLTDAGIPYKLSNGGGTVQVPADKLDQARLDLAGSNLLGGGGVGFEIFDKQSLSATDFTNRVNMLRAREGELARAIGKYEQVQTATVKLAMPDEKLFRSEQDPTTASIILDLKPGQTLDAEQVRGIVNLASSAIPGLKAEAVALTDTRGNILSGPGASAEQAGLNARVQAEADRERQIQSKLDAMLVNLVGPGKAVANVDVVLNMDQVQSEKETVDPDKSAPLDSATTEEKLLAEGGAGGGVAGVGSNTPGQPQFPAVTGNGAKTDYTKTTKTDRNVVDRTRSSIQEAPGDIERQTVSVLIDETVTTPEMLATIDEAVKGTVGYVDKPRVAGVLPDIVTVKPVKFADPKAVAAATDGGTTSTGTEAKGGLDMIGLAKTAAVGIGVLLLLFMARRSLRRRQTALERALPELLRRGPVPVAELSAASNVPALEGQKKSAIQQQMEQLALAKPEDVASLLRGWLLERGR